MTARCPYCDRTMDDQKAGLHPTRDHIIPSEWGGGYPDIEGRYRKVCETCNIIRGAAGHCIGVMACARAVAFDIYAGGDWRNSGTRAVLRRWSVPKPDGRWVRAIVHLQRYGRDKKFMAIGPRRYAGPLPNSALRLIIANGRSLYAFAAQDDLAWFLGAVPDTRRLRSVAELARV